MKNNINDIGLHEEQPLVTVIVLTYQQFEFVYSALNSVFNQTYPKIELIISDDGTQNFNEQIFNEFIISNKRDNIVDYRIIHHEKNVGTVKNLNNAITIAKGDYIMNLASDDLFYNSFVVKNVVDYFLETGAKVITTKREICSSDLKTSFGCLPKKEEIEYLLGNQNNLFARLCFGNFISGSCSYYSREMFKEYGLFDEDYVLLEDYPKYLSLSDAKERIWFLDIISIHYRLGGISTKKTKNLRLYDDQIRVAEEIVSSYNDSISKKLFLWKKFNVQQHKGFAFLLKFIIMHPLISLVKVLHKINCKYVKVDYIID